MSRKLPPAIDGIPDYSGAAVYALCDETGKAYIGSTNNLKLRLRTHSLTIRQVQREGRSAFGSRKIENAVLSGHRFHVKVLRMFPDGASHKELVSAERDFFLALGGLNGTYNSRVPVPAGGRSQV